MITLFEAPTAFVQIDGKKVVARPINYKYRNWRVDCTHLDALITSCKEWLDAHPELLEEPTDVSS